MPTIFVPKCATITMCYFEITFYRICINEFGETSGNFILKNQCLFLDDCETAINKIEIDPNRLLEILNFTNPSIKFAMETSDKELSFLDIYIKRNDNEIWINIYFKPPDTRRCVPFSSSYPSNCKKNITFILAWRFVSQRKTSSRN